MHKWSFYSQHESQGGGGGLSQSLGLGISGDFATKTSHKTPHLGDLGNSATSSWYLGGDMGQFLEGSWLLIVPDFFLASYYLTMVYDNVTKNIISMT